VIVKIAVTIKQSIKFLIKRARSYYYFGHVHVGVHGKITVGNKANVRIGKGCSVNAGVLIQGNHSIDIGDFVVLSSAVQLLDAGLDMDALVEQSKRIHVGKPVCIGDHSWVAASAIILPGVTLGKNTLVAAGSVVTKTFKDNAVIAGNPARLIRYRNTPVQ
jgi:maltose O-acetyltransferase